MASGMDVVFVVVFDSRINFFTCDESMKFYLHNLILRCI